MTTTKTAAQGLAVLIGMLSAFACSSPATNPSHAPALEPRQDSVVAVPAADPSDAAQVAAAFVVGWGSYDSAHDTPSTPAQRVAHLVTPELARQLSLSGPDRSWYGRPREISLLQPTKVFVPEGAPSPDQTRAYYTVLCQRITTGASGPDVTVADLSVELLHTGSSWLVNQVLFY